MTIEAISVRVEGVVQGVGFRPFVYRVAHAEGLSGWVINGDRGVEVHVEGPRASLDRFLATVHRTPPAAARIGDLTSCSTPVQGYAGFRIRESTTRQHPTTRISPDIGVCDDCVAEVLDPSNRRATYPYNNCTECGPRYSIILGLPYDREQTTMRTWTPCETCAGEYNDPGDRRFHAQPVACASCGPLYSLVDGNQEVSGEAAIRGAASMLSTGRIIAIKGIGGFHLACDAGNRRAVQDLRRLKYRKEKPFAVMVRDLEVAEELVELSDQARTLLQSPARPIVLAPSRSTLDGIAPGLVDLGILLPYSPLHALLFAHSTPRALVMTSANRSSQPIAYQDADALERLNGIASAFLVGERPIARRVDDSVATVGPFGQSVLRRSRGLAPDSVASLPKGPPILAVGADLKNSITLVVDGEALVSQHLGDLTEYRVQEAFESTIADLIAMYRVDPEDLIVMHDRHPHYVSTELALRLPSRSTHGVQHHHAHLGSVLAEHGAFEERVLGVVFDGTGYGDDGSIWGGEFFVGSVAAGFERVAHLRPARLPGGDAAARYPVQAAAGFLAQVQGVPDLTASPFCFPDRYHEALALMRKDLRSFTTTSVGRLFDTVAALLGFTRPMTFEGQAAIWVEHLARSSRSEMVYPFSWSEPELDFRPLLEAVMKDRLGDKDPADIARAFHRSVARAIGQAARELTRRHSVRTVVLSGGVFQNRLLLQDVKGELDCKVTPIWVNHEVPSNDGGISLGQAAFGAFVEPGPQ